MSNIVEYNGYHASIEFSAEDCMLIGAVIGVRDSLNFHGFSAEEAIDSFHSCIDSYLQMCAELGRDPDREYKGSFNVRMTPELHRTADLEARKMGISLNQYVQEAVEAKVSNKTPLITQITIGKVQINATPNTDSTFDKAMYKAPITFNRQWKGVS